MRAYIFAILTMALWGIAPAFEKLGVAKLSPLTAVSIRSFFIAVVLAAFFFASGGYGEVSRNPQGLPFIIIGGLFAGLLGQLTYFYALKTGDISRVVPVVASYPILSFIIGIAFLGEVVTLSKVAGAVLVTLGIFLLR